jgi:hypothetical protein
MDFALLTDDHIYYFYPVQRPGGSFFCTFTIDELVEDCTLRPLIQGGDRNPRVYGDEGELRRKAPYDLQVWMEFDARRRAGTPEDFYRRQLKEAEWYAGISC